MRTLASFAIVCLALLVLLLWELSSVPRQAATNAESPPRKTAPQPSPTSGALFAEGPAKAEEARVADAAPPRAPNQPKRNPPAPPVTPAPHITSDQPRAATQPTVRWATDLRQRRAKERFIELREILVSDPHNQVALEAALELARGLEWHNEACDLLARLVQLRAADARLRFELATLLMRLERWLEAVVQLRSVVAQEPGSARAWYNLAIAHQALGHLHDGRVAWDRAIELMPENPDAHAHRGEVLLDLHRWSAAAADFRTALRLEPGSIDAAMNLSLALGKLGQLDDARKPLLPILEQHPRHVPVLNRLADIAWALYQADPVANGLLSDEALNYCLRSLAVDPDQPEITALLERASRAGN